LDAEFYQRFIGVKISECSSDILMDFKNFYKIIQKNLKFILIFTAIVIAAILVFSWILSGGYNVSLAILVASRVENQTSADYQYSGYYSVKAADEFGNTISQLVKSPEIVIAVFQKARQAQSISSFKAQKMAPQYVEIKFIAHTQEQGRKISEALVSVLGEKVAKLNALSGNVIFSISGGEPIIFKNQQNYVFNGFIGLIGGVLLAMFVVLLKDDEC